MYKVLVTGSKHGDSTQVFRIKQYKQCEQGNHLTSETKEVETFNLRTDAVRALANLIAEELTLYNVTVQKASNGYAQVFYEYSNGNETLTYSVVATKENSK